MSDLQASSTRYEVLRLIRLAGGLTAQQLAAELKITSMGVRRYLVALERDGLVRVQMQRQAAGRPTYVYRLTEAGYDTFPSNYDLLATQLLDAVQVHDGDAKVDELFARRMDQLVAQYEPRMRGKDLGGRVAELARIQDENGYMAVWETMPDGYLLKEQNCAIYRVACRFQSACHYEIELFRRLLDAKIERIQHQIKGELTCAYHITPKVRRLRSKTGR
ncbi:MAG: transcriptional regulator [Chloroflexi bacterium]|nr:transcriptional regulator [Chloroflexota bacterium]